MEYKMKKIIIIVSMVILFVAIILLNGISVTTSDYIFTTKYYKSPQKAFEKENDEVEIEKDIKIYSIDENNCFYIALTNEADLLISKMFTKNDKFFYAGVYTLCDLNSIEQKVDKFSDNYYSDSIFDNKGHKSSTIKWNIKVVKNIEEENSTNLIYTHELNGLKYYICLVIE